MGTPVLLCLLLLGLCGTRVEAHGKHANRTRSGVKQQGAFCAVRAKMLVELLLHAGPCHPRSPSMATFLNTYF
jgi:hypothetical protein